MPDNKLIWQAAATLFGACLILAMVGLISAEMELDTLRAVPALEPDKVIFMQGCMADDNKEYQCILMWREHDGN